VWRSVCGEIPASRPASRTALLKVSLGSIKRLQSILKSIAPGESVGEILSPFYVLYDFRVASSHLASAETAATMLKTVTDRLGLEQTATLAEIYDRLTEQMLSSLGQMTAIIRGAPSPPSESAGNP
jgi:hypothetical protein